VVTVGEIPIGKGSVYIQLSSVEDVDIQVYDLDDTNEFSEGKAIVAWCPSQNCNKGVISSAGPVARIYPEGSPDARTYTYSGYNGLGGSKGFEFIGIDGVTSRRLLMRAYGYRAGEAVVTYSYMEQVP
jgi:hypothetical protein